MGKNAGSGTATPQVLIVGRLGYHETNVVEPILSALNYRQALFIRVGDVLDFFDSRYDQVEHAAQCAPEDLSRYNAVFFVDWWNLVLPLALYRCMGSRLPRLSGLVHGTVKIPQDVATRIPHAAPYERFLLSTYDVVICHSQWCADLLATNNCVVTGLPFDEQLHRTRPELPSARRIIYAHRWAVDKGNADFLRFVAACKSAGMEYEFIITDDAALENAEVKWMGIKVTGWLSQHELKGLCRTGGYAWSSAQSELAAYAVHDLVSYGLTPLTNKHLAYAHLPPRFQYDRIEQAIAIVASGDRMTNEEWRHSMAGQTNNADMIAEAIIG